jgi:ferredoxin-type protein NapH
MRRQRVRKIIGFVALLLFPATIFYMSPALCIEGASKGIVTGCVLFFLVIFIASLFLRRAHCGWTCLSTGIHDAGLFFVNKKIGMKSRIVKYLMWVPWLSSIVILFVVNGTAKVNVFYQMRHGLSVTDIPGYIVLYFFLALILTLALTAGRRSFCHHVCWMAPFMVVGSKLGRLLRLPSLHMVPATEKCNGCGLCSTKCPMSLPVKEMVAQGKMEHIDCIQCGECADNCVRKVIRYEFSAGN